MPPLLHAGADACCKELKGHYGQVKSRNDSREREENHEQISVRSIDIEKCVDSTEVEGIGRLLAQLKEQKNKAKYEIK